MDRAIKLAMKKPADLDFVDTLERKPVIEENYSSSEDTSGSEAYSYEDLGAERNTTVEMTTQSQWSSDEEEREFPKALTKPTCAAKRPAPPLFDGDAEDIVPPLGLNANGKRRATSPPSPPAYYTRLAKKARLTLIASTYSLSASLPSSQQDIV